MFISNKTMVSYKIKLTKNEVDALIVIINKDRGFQVIYSIGIL